MFQLSSARHLVLSPRWRVGRSKNRQTVSQGSKSSNNNWWGHPSHLPHLHKSSLRTASPLRSVIGGIGPENRGISRWEDRVSTHPSRRDGTQQDMTGDTWLQRGSRKQDNQVEVGKQPCGNLLSLAMSPTNLALERFFGSTITNGNQ